MFASTASVFPTIFTTWWQSDGGVTSWNRAKVNGDTPNEVMGWLRNVIKSHIHGHVTLHHLSRSPCPCWRRLWHPRRTSWRARCVLHLTPRRPCPCRRRLWHPRRPSWSAQCVCALAVSASRYPRWRHHLHRLLVLALVGGGCGILDVLLNALDVFVRCLAIHGRFILSTVCHGVLVLVGGGCASSASFLTRSMCSVSLMAPRERLRPSGRWCGSSAAGLANRTTYSMNITPPAVSAQPLDRNPGTQSPTAMAGGGTRGVG